MRKRQLHRRFWGAQNAGTAWAGCLEIEGGIEHGLSALNLEAARKAMRKQNQKYPVRMRMKGQAGRAVYTRDIYLPGMCMRKYSPPLTLMPG